MLFFFFLFQSSTRPCGLSGSYCLTVKNNLFLYLIKMENTVSTLLYFFLQSAQFSHSVMSNSATPWTAVYQASLSITNSWRLLKLMSIESVIPSNSLILIISFSFCLQSFPASGSFPMSQFYSSGGQTIGASASVLPMNIQDWFPLGFTGWISLHSKGLLRVFSKTTVQKHQFFGAQLSL